MFTKNSVIVQTWVKAVRNGDKKLSEVPNLSNLVAVVTEVVEGGEPNVQ